MARIGDYEIQSEIGRGPRCTLYEAVSKATGATVILKEFRMPEDTAPEFRDKYVARFTNECEWLRTVNHPNIIRVVEVIPPGVHGPAPVLVTEKLGKTLLASFQDKGTLDPQDVVACLVQILTGVKAFHQCGIIHRDIKPPNIMFDSAGTPKIIDLGIAVQLGQEITLAPEDITTQYAAPELYRGRAGATFATDVYSTGFMAYHLLCGRDKFSEMFQDVTGENELENLYRWMNWHCDASTKLRPLHEVDPQIPVYLSDVIAKMTAKKVVERYQTVDEVIEDLLVGTKEATDSFCFVIQKYVSSDYWRDPNAYSLDSSLLAGGPGAKPGPAKSGAGADVASDQRKTVPLLKRKGAMAAAISAAAVVVILLCSLVGFFLYGQAQDKRRQAELTSLAQSAIDDYRKSLYPPTSQKCSQGEKAIADARKESKFAALLTFFRGLGKDAVWIEGLERDLAAAQAAADKNAVEDARKKAEPIAALVYQEEGRPSIINKETSAKAKSLKDRAALLLAGLNKRTQQVTEVGEKIKLSLKEGKYRQAYYLVLTSGLAPADRETFLARVRPIVEALDSGRALFNQKKFVEAKAHYEKAQSMAKNSSLEACYFLQRINLWAVGSLEAAGQLGWRDQGIGADSIEKRLYDASVQMAELILRKYDLQEENLDAELATLRASADAILSSLAESAATQKEASPFYAPKAHDAIKFPIEDSKEYFRDLLADFRTLKLFLELEAGNADAVKDLFARVSPNLSALDQRYLEARMMGAGIDGAAPAEAVSNFQEIAQAVPWWTDCQFRIALLQFYKTNEVAKSLITFAQVVREAPQNRRYLFNAAKLAEREASNQVQQKQMEKARQLCEQSLKFWPDFPCAYFTMAMSYHGTDPAKEKEFLDRFESASAKFPYKYRDFVDNQKVLPEFRAALSRGK